MQMIAEPKHIEAARGMALAVVNDHLDGDEEAKEAVSEASFPGAASAERGAVEAGAMLGLIVSLTVGAIVTAFLLPIGLEELASSELGGNASSGATSLWGILDVIIVLAVFIMFIGVALSATGKI